MRIISTLFIIVASLWCFVTASEEPEQRRLNSPSRRRSRSLQDARIVGGTPAEVGEFPSFTWTTGTGLCGGSLIWEDIVLTAAHCFGSFERGILYNGINLNGGEGELFRGVVSEFPHPEYNNETDANDIMLVLLSNPATNVPFQELNFDPDQPISGESATVIGYGRVEETGNISQVLLQTEVDIVDFDTCDEFFRRILDDVMVCAGSGTAGRDSCAGDSGGPLLVDGVAVGIVSFGSGCARDNVPAVYTRISAYEEWISNGICDLSGNPPVSCPAANTTAPTMTPTTTEPSQSPTMVDISQSPTSSVPDTETPTTSPTERPTTKSPTVSPTNEPKTTIEPSQSPTMADTSASPNASPVPRSESPTVSPMEEPKSEFPTALPKEFPTALPTTLPTTLNDETGVPTEGGTMDSSTSSTSPTSERGTTAAPTGMTISPSIRPTPRTTTANPTLISTVLPTSMQPITSGPTMESNETTETPSADPLPAFATTEPTDDSIADQTSTPVMVPNLIPSINQPLSSPLPTVGVATRSPTKPSRPYRTPRGRGKGYKKSKGAKKQKHKWYHRSKHSGKEKKHKHKSKSSSSKSSSSDSQWHVQHKGIFTNDNFERPSDSAYPQSNNLGSTLGSVFHLIDNSQSTRSTDRFGSVALKQFLGTIDLDKEKGMTRESSFVQTVEILRLRGH